MLLFDMSHIYFEHVPATDKNNLFFLKKIKVPLLLIHPLTPFFHSLFLSWSFVTYDFLAFFLDYRYHWFSSFSGTSLNFPILRLTSFLTYESLRRSASRRQKIFQNSGPLNFSICHCQNPSEHF